MAAKTMITIVIIYIFMSVLIGGFAGSKILHSANQHAANQAQQIDEILNQLSN